MSAASYILSPDARQVACRRCGGEKTDPYGGRCQTCNGRGYFRERVYRRVDPEAGKIRAMLLSDREVSEVRAKTTRVNEDRRLIV